MALARPRVFLSHSASDKPRVHQIAQLLESRGIECWLDDEHIRVGDSIVEEIQRALEQVDFVLFFISSAAVRSQWVSREIASTIAAQLSARSGRVLPVKLDDVDTPRLLNDLRWADFREPVAQSELEALVRAIMHRRRAVLPAADDDAPFRLQRELEKLAAPRIHPRFRWFIVSGASSAGKDVLTHVVFEGLKTRYDLRKSTKLTTRPRRPSEPDYVKSISEDEFARREAAGDIVFPYEKRDYYYGFDARQMREAISSGLPLLSVFTHLERVPRIAEAMNARGYTTSAMFIEVPRENLDRRVLFRNLPPEEVTQRSRSIHRDFQDMASRPSFRSEYRFIGNGDGRAFDEAVDELRRCILDDLPS
ncbi:MAG TPA: TIR domain-containing protein [Longimicrobium sp.]|nr:TIR domain-containing protein [Longimicrobium sp.]